MPYDAIKSVKWPLLLEKGVQSMLKEKVMSMELMSDCTQRVRVGQG